MNRPEFDELMAKRRALGIYPHENDRKFFAKNSWPTRHYHVRKSVSTDDYEFAAKVLNPNDFITIVSRNFVFVVLPLDEARFGAFVNSDAYAVYRFQEAEKHFGKGRR